MRGEDTRLGEESLGGKRRRGGHSSKFPAAAALARGFTGETSANLQYSPTQKSPFKKNTGKDFLLFAKKLKVDKCFRLTLSNPAPESSSSSSSSSSLRISLWGKEEEREREGRCWLGGGGNGRGTNEAFHTSPHLKRRREDIFPPHTLTILYPSSSPGGIAKLCGGDFFFPLFS